MIRNIVDKIIKYESGDMSEEEDIIEFFQELYDSGIWQHLQGHYSETMTSLIEQGCVN